MNLTAYAEQEMKAVGLHEPDADYGGMIYDAVLELVKTFAEQGHSGTSAAQTLAIFSKVAAFQPLKPLTGEDDEWTDVSEEYYQNKRNYAVFKEKATGRSYFLDAIVWKTQNGGHYTGSTEDGTESRQYIRSFPFVPKTFYVDVVEREVAKDDWAFAIKDREQLLEVGEYYDMAYEEAKA